MKPTGDCSGPGRKPGSYMTESLVTRFTVEFECMGLRLYLFITESYFTVGMHELPLAVQLNQ